jgi:tyrosine-protein phosphatase YwqE
MFFNKYKSHPVDLGDVICDMHSHILPGIDDGAKNTQQSEVLIEGLRELGFEKFVYSPHVMGDYFPNNNESIEGALNELNYYYSSNNKKLIHAAAAEYFYDDHLRNLVDEKQIRTLGNSHYFLFELSFKMKPHGIRDFVYKAQLQGYKPVLAHPERYEYLSVDDYIDLHQRGVLFQLDVMALTTHYGKSARKKAEEMINKGLYSFLGTDVHHEGHLAVVKKALRAKSCHQLVESGRLKNKSLIL